MPKFRVSLERVVDSDIKNPFAGLRHISLDHKVRLLVRTWEFEAKNEKAVRKFLKEAIEQDLPYVRGYHLRSIEQI